MVLCMSFGALHKLLGNAFPVFAKPRDSDGAKKTNKKNIKCDGK